MSVTENKTAKTGMMKLCNPVLKLEELQKEETIMMKIPFGIVSLTHFHAQSQGNVLARVWYVSVSSVCIFFQVGFVSGL